MSKAKKKAKAAPKQFTLEQAYKRMIFREDARDILHVQNQTILNRRVMVRQGVFPRDATMRAWLKRAGWRQAVVELWKE